MSQRRLFIAGWLVLLGLSAAVPLSAVFRGVVHVGGGPLVLQASATRPVISLGRDVVVPHGSHNVIVVIGADIRARGSIRDDLVSLDGNIYLGRNTHASADILSIIGGIYRAGGVQVDGRLGGALHPWNGASATRTHRLRSAVTNSVRLGLAAGLALLLVGTCLTIVFPWQVVLISSTLRSAPVKSVGAGAASLVAFVFLVVPLALSLAGLPFALLLAGAASLAWLFGMTAAAVVLGRALARRGVPLLWATSAGLIVLALIMAVPVVGPLAVTLVGLTGAGALAVALLSRARPATPLL
ncbi:MAG TPA: hypothetical protein VF221_07220 [Chloroflexota bacterium]